VRTAQPWGRKSQAVLSLGGGMPGASGEENMSGPPMSGALAKEPGVVTPWVLPGLMPPRRGGEKRGSGIAFEFMIVFLEKWRRTVAETEEPAEQGLTLGWDQRVCVRRGPRCRRGGRRRRPFP